MLRLSIKIIIPLTIISFTVFTKYWYALPVDAPDTIFTGFPLAYSCPGWHTSMSLQIFIKEFIVDILTYFTFWFVLLYLVNQFLIKIKTYKWLTIILWTTSVLIIGYGTLLAFNKDNLFYVKRPFEMQVLKTEYKFIWQKFEQTGAFRK